MPCCGDCKQGCLSLGVPQHTFGHYAESPSCSSEANSIGCSPARRNSPLDRGSFPQPAQPGRPSTRPAIAQLTDNCPLSHSAAQVRACSAPARLEWPWTRMLLCSPRKKSRYPRASGSWRREDSGRRYRAAHQRIPRTLDQRLPCIPRIRRETGTALDRHRRPPRR